MLTWIKTIRISIKMTVYCIWTHHVCAINKPINSLNIAIKIGYYLMQTLLSIRSSCSPSHHWASQGFHFAGLNSISLAGPSRWPGEGRYPQNINWSLGFPRARFLDLSSSPHTLHHWVASYKHMVSHTIAMLMTYSSIPHFDQMIKR